MAIENSVKAVFYLDGVKNSLRFCTDAPTLFSAFSQTSNALEASSHDPFARRSIEREKQRARFGDSVDRERQGDFQGAILILEALDLPQILNATDLSADPQSGGARYERLKAHISEILESLLERETQQNGGLFQHLEPDMWALFIPDAQKAEHVAKELLRKLDRQTITTPHTEFAVPKVNIGISDTRLPHPYASTMLQEACEALDELNASCTFRAYKNPPQDAQKMAEYLEIAEEVAGRSLELYLQPIVDPCTGQVVKYECLARLGLESTGRKTRFSGKPLFPDQIFPALAALRQENLFDRKVLRAAFDLLKEHSDICLSINVTKSGLVDPLWQEILFEALQEAPDLGKRSTVEIIETGRIEDAHKEILRQIRRRGVSIALDDFGTGDTAIGNILIDPNEEPFLDVVKCDRSFLAGETAMKNLRSLADVAKNAGCLVVVEGVETPEELEAIRDLNVGALVQGYYFAKPLPVPAALALAAEIPARVQRDLAARPAANAYLFTFPTFLELNAA